MKRDRRFKAAKGSNKSKNIPYNDETWYSYTLPKEDPKTV